MRSHGLQAAGSQREGAGHDETPKSGTASVRRSGNAPSKPFESPCGYATAIEYCASSVHCRTRHRPGRRAPSGVFSKTAPSDERAQKESKGRLSPSPVALRKASFRVHTSKNVFRAAAAEGADAMAWASRSWNSVRTRGRNSHPQRWHSTSAPTGHRKEKAQATRSRAWESEKNSLS